MSLPRWPKCKRQKAAKKVRREALNADRFDALVGNKTVAQIQAEAAAAQRAERHRLLMEAQKRDREAGASETN